MSSRSLCLPPARTHFWTETARLYGGVSSPVKNDLNGTIPATVKSSVLSTGITDADGTCEWARSVKNSTKARRSSSDVVGRSGIEEKVYFPPVRAELPLREASRARMASRPSLTAARTLSLQRSTTSGGANRTATRRTRRIRVHDDPTPSRKPV